MRFVITFVLMLWAAVAQAQYPPELPPVTPQVTFFGFHSVPAPRQDFQPARDGRPVTVLFLFPANTATSQADADAKCAPMQAWNNTVYTNSKTSLMQVVGCVYVPSYTSTTMSADLSWGSGSTLAFNLREQYQADFVQVASAETTYCGLGYMNCWTYGKQFCTSVVQWTCAQYHLSSVHEMGHNEGVEHDDANASRDAYQPDGYGWHNLTNNNADPMSYVGDRQMSFSEMDLTVNGAVFGDANHQTARTLRLTMPIIANFYPPVSTLAAPVNHVR